MENDIQHDDEWGMMLEYVGKFGFGSFLEVGTAGGGTFDSLASRCEGIKISVDLCTGKFGGIGVERAGLRNARLMAKYPNSHFIEGNSVHVETLMRVYGLLGGKKVDLLFLDGDHTYYGVLADYLLYRQFLVQGGCVIFHDIIDSQFHRNAGCFVSKLWKELVGMEFISPSSYGEGGVLRSDAWGGIGVIRNGVV